MSSGVFCDTCGHELEVGEYPFCKGNPAEHTPGRGIVEGDEIDVWIKHALCWPDGSPRHFRSREELKKVAEEKGYTNYVVHTDHDKYVKSWVAIPYGVTPEEEATRITHWHEHEAQLQAELANKR